MKVNVSLFGVPWKSYVSTVKALRAAAPGLGLRQAAGWVSPAITSRYDVVAKKWIEDSNETTFFSIEVEKGIGQLFDALRDLGVGFELDTDDGSFCRLVNYASEASHV